MSSSGSERKLELPIADLDLPAGFSLPDWQAPFDLAAHLREVPAGSTVKGMFLTATVENVEALGGPVLTEERFTAFRDYPLSRNLELMVEGARHVYADLPLRDGMRQLARPAFTVFASSLIGRAVFAATGRDPRLILRLASRAWRHATNAGKLETMERDETSVLVRVSEFFLTDAVAVGIAEGVLEACGRGGQVALRMHSSTAGELLIRWV